MAAGIRPHASPAHHPPAPEMVPRLRISSGADAAEMAHQDSVRTTQVGMAVAPARKVPCWQHQRIYAK